MLKLPFVLLYTAMTFLAWGVYGILLHQGQEAMGHSYLKPFVGVGIAYFLIAVLGAGAMLGGTNEKGFWSLSGTLLSLLAGSVGAIGALGVILALAFGGLPVYVMPLVFGGAPVVNTLVTSWLGNTFHKIKPLFVIGMILVAVGMIGVLMFKPAPIKKAIAVEHAAMIDQNRDASRAKVLEIVFADVSGGTSSETTIETIAEKAEEKVGGFLYVMASILVAVVCWGSYGPVLHLGQMRMGGSRLRPFCCVGLAYFAIAVAMPLMLLPIDQGHWDWTGMFWSIAAGTAGAIGALGIILAFNSGGKPVFVMPLVFGFAPVVNTLTSMWLSKQLNNIHPVFAASLATVIGGAVMVLIFAPKSGHAPPKSDSTLTPIPPPEPPAPIETTPTPVTSEVTATNISTDTVTDVPIDKTGS